MAEATAQSGVVLYLSAIEGSPSHAAKLSGIRRYCAQRGWNAVPVPRDDVSAAALPGILRKHRPAGCIVEGVGRYADLPPRLFGAIPVSYIGYPDRLAAGCPNSNFDTGAIVETAFRELSANSPPCYAVVGHPRPWKWSRGRVRSFRAAARASGAKCHAFPAISLLQGESDDAFVARLASWMARLPQHCAVFAVSDETALLATRAAHLAGRPIPRSMTLLSVDNFTDICENADPPISSIQLDFEREGYMAARALETDASRGVALDAARSRMIAPLMVVRRASTAGRGRREKFILDAVEMIRREACDGLSAREVAARFPGSRRLFELRFREAMGHSVLDEILHIRLEKAFTLLAQTDTAVGAVPALCGFRCDRTLDALFRSRCGMSMSEWRRRNRG